ncbi:hypothetical protein J4459_00690 [Candidatus Woesearchaeota archaeon]|nr:hypothetical protein [Candidatus Woesearchaeota archaeon]
MNSTLQKVVEKIKTTKNYEVVSSYQEEPIKNEKIFSAFTELELKIDTLQNLFLFCFDYLPSSVEILDKTELNLQTKDFSNGLNDMLLRLHRYHTGIANLHAAHEKLKEEITPQEKH